MLCTIATLFLFTGRIHNQYADFYLQQDRLKDNVESALRLVMTNPTLVSYNERKVLDVFGDQQDSVSILKTRWGAFTNWEISSNWSGSSYTKYFMTGVNFQKGEPIALYLTEKDNYLSVSGSTLIRGNAYLPKLGVRKAYIEGSGSAQEKMIDGEKFRSARLLPKPDSLFIKYLSKWLNGRFNDMDSIMTFEHALQKGFLRNPFSKRPLILYSNNDILMDNGLVLEGNILIYSSKSIVVQKNAKLNTCLLFAPVVKFIEGFTGSVQAFASDSMFVEKGCKLKYPAYIGLLNEAFNNCIIKIEKGASIEGGIFVWQKNKAVHEPYILIEDSATITGQVFCKGNIELKGTINGSVYCNGFNLRTASSFYENHLLNATINFKKLPKTFAGYDGSLKVNKQNLVQCLE